MIKLFPHDKITSAYDVDYAALRDSGVRAVFFDTDNTLVPHDAPADKAAKALIFRIRRTGLVVYIISNNDEPRVRSFSDDSGCDGYIYKAGKPLSKGFDEAMTRLSLSADDVIYFGDQIFTDVAGGRNAGLWTVLTCPIDHSEPFHIILKRIAELPIIAAYMLICLFTRPKRPVPLLADSSAVPKPARKRRKK